MPAKTFIEQFWASFLKLAADIKAKLSFSAFLYGYVLLIGIWAFLWVYVGDVNWWLTLINRLVPYLFIPVPFFIIQSLRSHRFKIMTALIVPILIFGALYHPYILPKWGQAESMSDLSLMTYNVLFSNFNYEAVANVILTNQPDLVALQEVQPEMMAALQELLDSDYPYSQLGADNPYGTTAVFSRHPILDSYVLDLEADRSAVVVNTEIENRPVTFISVHLLAYGLWWFDLRDIPAAVVQRTADQNRQAQILVSEINKQDGIVILGCDCNSKETSSSYRILANVMTNTARKFGWVVNLSEFTNAKRDRNLQHIDYLFYRGSLAPLSHQVVLDNGGSDHRPVMASYAFD